MTQPIRNFFIRTVVDGLKRDFGSGPRHSHGGMVSTITVKKEGAIHTAVTIDCQVRGDGTRVILVDLDGYPKTIRLEYK